MNYIATPLLMIMAFTACAQKKDTLFRYFDHQLQLTDRAHAVATGLLVRHNDQWDVLIRYPEGQRLMTGTYKDKRLEVKNGWFTIYYVSGKRMLLSHYSNNVIDDTWESWYENGQIKDSGRVDNNNKTGGWKSWHQNGQLKDSGNYHHGFKNGPWKSWYANGRLESSGSYDNDQMTGTWEWYHENGFPATKETYVNNQLDQLECYDEKGNPLGSGCPVNIPAQFPGGSAAFDHFIVTHLFYPPEAVKQRIEGEVKFGCWIRKDGQLGDIIIESSPDQLLSDEVKRMLHAMPTWEPAIQHNRKIDYYFTLTLPFYLQH